MVASLTTANVFSNGNFASNRIAIRPPTLTGLQSWVFSRSSPTPSNLISGGPTLANYGAGPVLEPAWGNFAYNATVGSNQAYDSGVADATTMTLMAVAQSPGGGGGLTLFSNYSPNGIDFYIDQTGNGIGALISGSINQAIEYPVPGGSILNWGFYGLTIGPAGLFVYAPTVGIAASLTYSSVLTVTTATSATISMTATGSFAGSPTTITYALGSSDTAATAIAGLAAACNASTVLQAAHIFAATHTSNLTMTQPVSTAYTFSATSTGSVSFTSIASTSTHLLNTAQTLKVGSTVSGGARGTGSIAWFAAAPGLQASAAQIQQTYAALQASLAIDGINI